MFNPVSYAIYSSAGISRDDALKGAEIFRAEVRLIGIPKNWQEFDLSFPSVNRLQMIWSSVARVSFRFQVGSAVLAGFGIIGALVKYQQKSLPQAALSTAVAAMALFIALAARRVGVEARDQWVELDERMIRSEVRGLRLGAYDQGPERLKNPSDIRFFTTKEVDTILRNWIVREHYKSLSSSSSSSSTLSSSTSTWTLDELNKPENKVVKALLAKFNEFYPINRALQDCQDQSQTVNFGSFSQRFLGAYSKYSS